jgi:hypothetical protein
MCTPEANTQTGVALKELMGCLRFSVVLSWCWIWHGLFPQPMISTLCTEYLLYCIIVLWNTHKRARLVVFSVVNQRSRSIFADYKVISTTNCALSNSTVEQDRDVKLNPSTTETLQIRCTVLHVQEAIIVGPCANINITCSYIHDCLYEFFLWYLQKVSWSYTARRMFQFKIAGPESTRQQIKFGYTSSSGVR